MTLTVKAAAPHLWETTWENREGSYPGKAVVAIADVVSQHLGMTRTQIYIYRPGAGWRWGTRAGQWGWRMSVEPLAQGLLRGREDKRPRGNIQGLRLRFWYYSKQDRDTVIGMKGIHHIIQNSQLLASSSHSRARTAAVAQRWRKE